MKKLMGNIGRLPQFWHACFIFWCSELEILTYVIIRDSSASLPEGQHRRECQSLPRSCLSPPGETSFPWEASLKSWRKPVISEISLLLEHIFQKQRKRLQGQQRPGGNRLGVMMSDDEWWWVMMSDDEWWWVWWWVMMSDVLGGCS